jgi:hypothetical protein
MIQVKIIRDSVVTNSGSFPSQEEAQVWLSSHEGMGSFGQKRQVISHPAISNESQVEISPAVIDEDGVEISPAQFETQVTEVPAREEVLEGYTVEIVDISAQLEQEAVNKQSLEFLAATDYIVVRAAERNEELSAEFKAQREAARAAIVRS